MATNKDNENNSQKQGIVHKTLFLKITCLFFAILSVIALAFITLALLQGTFSSKKEPQVYNNFIAAKAAFESRTGIDNAWFKEGIKLPDTLLFINTQDKKFVWKVQDNRNVISYENIGNNNATKHIIDNDTSKFNSFVTQYFLIEESNNIDSLAKLIGAQTTYITNIKQQGKMNQRDIVFSLIYNTIVGDPKGHIAVSIKNQNLQLLTANDMLFDKIDKNLFIESMNWVASKDTLSNKDKFIWANFNQLSNSQQDESDTAINSIQVLKLYFNKDNVVQINRKLPVDFMYYDFRKDVLHIGVNEYKFDKKSDEKIKQYVEQILFFPEDVFYESSDKLGKLSELGTIDNVLWGKIDTAKLAAGKFTIDDIAKNYAIIKTWGKSVWIYIAILILFVYIAFSYWFLKHRRQPAVSTTSESKEVNIDIDKVDSLTEEEKSEFENIKKTLEEHYKTAVDSLSSKSTQLEQDRKEFETLQQKWVQDFKNQEAQIKNKLEKQYFNTIAELNNKIDILEEEKETNIKTFKEQVQFETLKKQSDFLVRIANTRKEKDLLNLLEELRKQFKELPEILSLKKIYRNLEAKKNGQKDEIIIALLSEVDEYAKGKELTPQFSNYKNQTEEYRKILQKYNDTHKQIEEFYKLCQKLPKKETTDFWDRTALSVWSISQIAMPLLKIWGKTVWFENKVDEKTITPLKADLLCVYLTKYFERDTSNNYTLDEFKVDLDTTYRSAIKKYNDNIATNTNAVLDDNVDTIKNLKQQFLFVFEKIKKFESSQEFADKMWNNFVKDFLQKAPKLNEQSPEGKAWFFEQLFNITYHTADYLDFVKNNKSIIYCYNHLLLHNNLDLSKTDHYDFQLNHIEKSTTYSNRIYKWADELGVKHLKVLIEKYLIKP